MSQAAQFEDYLLDHFVVQYVSSKTEILLEDDCPFCGSSGRLYVNRKKGTGICHKCSTPFSGPKFVAEYEGVSYGKALAILNGREGFEDLDTEDTKEDIDAPVWFPVTSEILRGSIQFNYLAERGIDENLIRYFGLTFCETNTQVGDKVYWTANRIMIPLFDHNGVPVGWQGRDITGKSKIKYLFMPGFKGAECLFNLRSASKRYVIICEGAMDVFGWWRAGFTSVVGTFGKKISEYQLELLAAQDPDEVFVAWDGDAVKERYAFVELHGHRFRSVKIVDLGSSDSDELGGAALANCLIKAAPYDWSSKILNLL
jgi:DNA primase